ncbi:MAG: HTH domain-containing protein [Acidobacteria bacterium]|nr:HTH domain-containing protein [Acidobacteriota bacterium]
MLPLQMIGGRKRYNAQRQQMAFERRRQILATVGDVVILPERGRAARLASVLNVSEATISRDLKAIRAEFGAAHVCRYCGMMFFGMPLLTWAKILRAIGKPTCCAKYAFEIEAKKTRAQKRKRMFG